MGVQAGLIDSDCSQGLTLDKPFHFLHLERGPYFLLCHFVVCGDEKNVCRVTSRILRPRQGQVNRCGGTGDRGRCGVAVVTNPPLGHRVPLCGAPLTALSPHVPYSFVPTSR